MHWANGGETKLSNLITVCFFHHRLLHEGGYGVYRTDDGEFVFTRPDSSRVEPNGKHLLRGDAFITGRSGTREPALFAINRERGLEIDSETSRCRWDGGRMDYSMAIEHLHFLDDRHQARKTSVPKTDPTKPRPVDSPPPVPTPPLPPPTASLPPPASALPPPASAPQPAASSPESDVPAARPCSDEKWLQVRRRMFVDLVEKLKLTDDEGLLADLGLTREDFCHNAAGPAERRR